VVAMLSMASNGELGGRGERGGEGTVGDRLEHTNCLRRNRSTPKKKKK